MDYVKPISIIFLLCSAVSLRAMEEEPVIKEISLDKWMQLYTGASKDMRGMLQREYVKAEGWQPLFESRCYVRHREEDFLPEDICRAVPYIYGKNQNKVFRQKNGKMFQEPFLTNAKYATPAKYVFGPNRRGDLVHSNKIVYNGIVVSLKSEFGGSVEVLALHPHDTKVLAKSLLSRAKSVYVFDFEKGKVVKLMKLENARSVCAAAITHDDRVIVSYFDAQACLYRLCTAQYSDLKVQDCTLSEGWLPPKSLESLQGKILPDDKESRKVVTYINNLQSHPIYSHLILLELQPRIMRCYSASNYVLQESVPYYEYALYDTVHKRIHYLGLKKQCHDDQLMGLGRFLCDFDSYAPHSVQFADHIPLHGEHTIRSLQYELPKARTVVRLKTLDNNDCVYSILLIALARQWLQQKRIDIAKGKEILQFLYDKKFIDNRLKLLWQCTSKLVSAKGKVSRTNPFKDIYFKLYPKKKVVKKLIAWVGSKGNKKGLLRSSD